MLKGIDPGLEAAGMKSRSMSFEMCRFLLKYYETAFPLVDASHANPHGYGPIHRFGQDSCGVECRSTFLRVGHYYICLSSGNFHFCPPDGCREGKVRGDTQHRHCPITGNDSYALHTDEFERTRGLKRSIDEADYESIAKMQDPDDTAEEDIQSSKRARTSSGGPKTGTRLSKEGQQSTSKDIQLIQSKADMAVQAVLPASVVPSTLLRWIVDEHVLYLWKVVLQTAQYQQHSMRYKLAQHVQVVLDGMVDGVAIENRVVIPQVAVIRQAVLERKVSSIQPDLASKKFFNAALKEALGENPEDRARRLDVIHRRS